MIKSIFIIILNLILFPSFCLGATLYISPSGTDSGGCTSIESPCLTLGYAIPKLTAGSILYCRGGEYTSIDDHSVTAASGTSGNPIIVKNYPNETPIFRTRGRLTVDDAIVIVQNNYWIFDGLQFQPTDTTKNNYSSYAFYMNSGSHTVLRNLTVQGHYTGKAITNITKDNPAVVTVANHGFSNGSQCVITDVEGMTQVNGNRYTLANVTTDTFELSGVDSSGYSDYTSGGIANVKYTFNNVILSLTDHNEIYNCTLSGGGQFNSYMGQSGSVILLYGSYNKIHHNSLSHGCHDVIGMYDAEGLTITYNEIYSNLIDHALGYGVYIESSGDHNLVQDNSVTGSNESPILYVKNPIYIKGSRTIVRRNNGWDGGSYGYVQDYAQEANNRVYNNVFYNNYSSGIYIAYSTSAATGNKFYNNVFAKNGANQSQPYMNKEVSDNTTVTSYWANAYNNEMKNNYIVAYQDGEWKNDWASSFVWALNPGYDKTVSWMEANYSNWANNIYNYCDPRFKDATNGNFTILNNSCLIDVGRHLTTTNGSRTNSTTLIVNDALFFWPGDVLRTFGSISSINYDTNTITLDSEATWDDGDNVDLIYYGNAPDIGSSEYQSTFNNYYGITSGGASFR